MPSTYHLRVAHTLHAVEDLDSLQMLYVSSQQADSSPALQRAFLVMLDNERMRREAGVEQPESIELPEFADWPPSDWIAAGEVVIKATETAALHGDPTLMDFVFRFQVWWYLQISTQVMEASLCRPASD